MKLTGRLLRVADVTARQREQMFALMDRHYRNICRERFEADLAEKQWVILVLEPLTREVCGFSTQMVLRAQAGGRPVRALFSGDTIIDRRHWGDSALAHVWGRLALALIDEHAGEEWYWFLISKGYKTYRFLPIFFQQFYPRPGVPTPGWAGEVLEALARSKFPGEYDAARGVVRAGPGKESLRDEVAPVTAGRLADPHVRFFVERNPGHLWGEELCCVAPLSRANFTPAAYRVIGPESAEVVSR